MFENEADALVERATRHYPLPIADATLNFVCAENAFERGLRAADVVRATIRWVAGVALAASLQPDLRQQAPSSETRRLVRSLRTRALTDGSWWALARELLRPFEECPAAHPIPSLVEFVHVGSARRDTAQQIDALLAFRNRFVHESPPSASEATQMLAETLPVLKLWLERLDTALTSTQLVVALGHPHEAESLQRAYLLSGSAPARGRWRRIDLADGVRIQPGETLLVDTSGRPVLSLAPVVRALRPSPEHGEELFFLDGKGKRGSTRYLSLPNGEEFEEEAVWDQIDQVFGEELSPAQVGELPASPFRGLSSFGPGDTAVFFGREKETIALANLVRREGLVTLTGPSGVGKTSMLRAGVGPALERRHRQAEEASRDEKLADASTVHAAVAAKYVWIYMRPGGAPLAALRCALAPLLEDEAFDTDGDIDESWVDTVLAIMLTQRRILVLVLDQAEELLTQGATAQEVETFGRLLVALGASANQPARVILSVRGDYFHRLAGVMAFRDRYEAHVCVLGRLRREDLLRTLREPTRQFQTAFEPGLAEAMVDEVVDEEAGLPLLQFAAAALWATREERRELSFEAYSDLGGVRGALVSHAEATFGDLDASEQEFARTLLLSMTADGGTRLLVGVAELRARTGYNGVDGLLERFVAARLVTTRRAEDGGPPAYELTHESLAELWPRLRSWREEASARLLHLSVLRAAVKAWEASGRSRDLLWRGDALAAHRRWASQVSVGLQDSEHVFVKTSAATERRGRRARIGVTSSVMLALLGIAGTAAYQWREASEQSSLAREALVEAELNAAQATGTALLAETRRLQQGAEPHRGLALARVVGSGEFGNDMAVASVRVALADPGRHGADTIVRVLAHPSGGVHHAAFAPDGSQVATAASDGIARVWRADSGELLFSLSGRETGALDVATDDLFGIAYSPDGEHLVTGARDGVVFLWDLSSQTATRVVHADESPIFHVEYSSDGRRVLTAARGGLVRVWDAAFSAHVELADRGASSVRFSPDGSLVAVGTEDGRVSVWDAASGTPRFERPGHARPVSGVAFAPQGGLLVTTSVDGVGIVWDATSETEVSRFDHGDGAILAVALSGDGQLVVTGSEDGTAKLWESGSGRLRHLLPGPGEAVTSVAFSPDGAQLITGSADGWLRRWDAGSGALQHVHASPHARPVLAVYSASGERVLGWHQGGDAFVLSGLDGEASTVLRGHGGEIEGVVFSPDGNHIATTSRDGTARVWDARDGRPLYEPLRHEDWVASASFSPDGQLLATAGHDSKVRIWDVASGRPLRVLDDHTQAVGSVVFSSDGSRLLTTSHDGSARVWDVSTWARRQSLRHPAAVVHAAFSSDGAQVVTATSDTIFVWNLESSRALAEHAAQNADVMQVGFSADGRTVVYASEGGARVRAWRVGSEADSEVVRADGEDLGTTIYSPDGRQQATALPDGEIRIVDVASGLEIRRLRGHRHPVNALAFSRDGARLVTGAEDGTARVWDVSAQSPFARAVQLATRDNLRVCRDSYAVVVTPLLPDADPFWAPQGLCARDTE